MFLKPLSLPTSFILTQISLVVFVVKNATFTFLYPSAHIKNILHIQKKKKYYLHKVINNFDYFLQLKVIHLFFNFYIFNGIAFKPDLINIFH